MHGYTSCVAKFKARFSRLHNYDIRKATGRLYSNESMTDSQTKGNYPLVLDSLTVSITYTEMPIRQRSDRVVAMSCINIGSLL